MPSKQIIDMAKKFIELKEEYSEAKETAEEAKRKLDEAENNLFQVMEVEGVPRFEIDGIGLFYKYARPWAKIIDFEKAQEFFKEQGIFDEMFKLKEVSKRLNAYVKEEFLEKKKVIPEDDIGVSVTLTQTIGLRKS